MAKESSNTKLNELVAACKASAIHQQSDQKLIESGETIWIGGSPAPASPGTIALKTGEHTTIVNIGDVLEAEKVEGLYLVNLKVGTSLLHRFETMSKVEPFENCNCKQQDGTEGSGSNETGGSLARRSIWDRIKGVFRRCRVYQECEWIRDPATGRVFKFCTSWVECKWVWG